MPVINFDYNQSINGLHDARIGKLATQISAFIEGESSRREAQQKFEQLFFNHVPVDGPETTTIIEDDIGLMHPTFDGNDPERDKWNELGKKTTSFVPFTKEIWVTKQMIDDARGKLSYSMQNAGKKLPRAYWDTRHTLEVKALVNSCLGNTSVEFLGTNVDVSAPYNYKQAAIKPLFDKAHGTGGDLHGYTTQSNFFYVVDTAMTAEKLREYIQQLAVAGRQLKDENLKPIGAVYDRMLIAGNSAKFEDLIRTAIGSNVMPFASNNTPNTQYALYDLFIEPEWEYANANYYDIILYSSRLNDDLGGSNFFDRKALDVKVGYDDHKRALYWNAYTRMNVGFHSWKHAVRLRIYTDGAVATSGKQGYIDSITSYASAL